MFFSQELLNGFAGKEKRQMDGKLKTQLDAFLMTVHINCHFQLISVVKITKNVAADKKSSLNLSFALNLVPRMLEMAF